MFRSFKINSASCIIVVCLCILAFYGAVNTYTTDVAVSAQIETECDVPIIMYHGVSADESIQNDYVISPAELECDLEYLSEHNYTTVFVSDLVNYVNEGVPLPQNPIVLTFDDGYYNNYLYLYPLLKKYSCKALISPIAYYSDMYSENGEVNERYTHCTWQQLSEMYGSGLVEIGNHTYNMHSYGNGRNGIGQMSGEDTDMYKSLIKEDISKAECLIKENTGVDCEVFAYPFGIWCDSSLEVIKELDYKAVLTVESGINHLKQGRSDDLYTLKRLIRPHGSGFDLESILRE